MELSIYPPRRGWVGSEPTQDSAAWVNLLAGRPQASVCTSLCLSLQMGRMGIRGLLGGCPGFISVQDFAHFLAQASAM